MRQLVKRLIPTTRNTIS